MAHYALLDENNIVTQVITGLDESELIEGIDPETWYGQFHNQTCKRTSYNTYENQHQHGGTPFRKNYAGIGYTYSEELDGFIPPKPFPSWILNEQTCVWEAPIPKPENTNTFWDENSLSWLEIQAD